MWQYLEQCIKHQCRIHIYRGTVYYVLQQNTTAVCHRHNLLTYFRMKCIRVAFETSSDRPQPIDLMFKIICTAAAVAAITELAIRKTVAIPTYTQSFTVLEILSLN